MHCGTKRYEENMGGPDTGNEMARREMNYGYGGMAKKV
jgi:hypothetical protein